MKWLWAALVAAVATFGPARADDVVVRGIRTRHREVVLDRSREELRVLQHDAEGLPEFVRREVREIAPQADPVTRARRVRISLENPPDTFRLGTTITTLIPGPPAKGFRLPATAILREGDQASVWIIDTKAGTVARRKVAIVASDDGWVEVTGEIEAGARVVTAGVHHLRDGQKVRFDEGAAS